MSHFIDAIALAASRGAGSHKPTQYSQMEEVKRDAESNSFCSESDTEATTTFTPSHNSRDNRIRAKIIGLVICAGVLILIFIIFAILAFTINLASDTPSAPALDQASWILSQADAERKGGPIPLKYNDASELPPAQYPARQKSSGFSCGPTPDDAVAKGCIFDVMTISWQHPDCYDEELSREFEALGPWDFYWSSRPGTEIPEPHMLTPIPDYETLGRQTTRVWSSREYHITHCTYAWKMMHRALERGWRMDGLLAAMSHTDHCTHLIMNTTSGEGPTMDKIMTKTNIQFPSC